MTNLVFFWRFEHITGYPRYHFCSTPLFTSNEFITAVLPVISGSYRKCHFHLRFRPMSEGTLGTPSLWLRRDVNPQDCGLHAISMFSNPITIDKVRTNTRQDCDDAQIPLSLSRWDTVTADTHGLCVHLTIQTDAECLWLRLTQETAAAVGHTRAQWPQGCAYYPSPLSLFYRVTMHKSSSESKIFRSYK